LAVVLDAAAVRKAKAKRSLDILTSLVEGETEYTRK